MSDIQQSVQVPSEPIDPGPCQSHSDFPNRCDAHGSHFFDSASVCVAAQMQREERGIHTCPYHRGEPLINESPDPDYCFCKLCSDEAG